MTLGKPFSNLQNASVRKPDDMGGMLLHAVTSRYILVVFIVIEITIFSLLSPEFFTVPNLLNMGKHMAVLGIVSVGATFGLISGAVDLSVGSVIALSGMIGAWLLKMEQPPIIAILGSLGFCVVIGIINGLVVTKLKVNPIVATLGMMGIARGLALIWTGARGMPIRNEVYNIFQGKIGPFPWPLILLVTVFLVGYIVLSHTRFGRYAFAVGGNSNASRAAAIPVDRLRISYLAISGLLAGVSGWVLASMSGAATPAAAQGYELTVITAVILGGVSLSGGRGSMTGTILGSLIIGVMVNGMTLRGIQSYYQLMLQGLVLLIAVWVDSRRTGGYR
jgi:ribose transport system permease protein